MVKIKAGFESRLVFFQTLQITHRQWTYRNRTAHHIKARDGLTEYQQLEIMKHCEDILWPDPSTLLHEDRGLLEVDFEELGEDRQWLGRCGLQK
jgi:hypothetical protein